MDILIIIIIIIFILIVICLIKRIVDKNNNIESFSNIIEEEEELNELNDKYLYPLTGLTDICAKNDLLPSYMPKICYVDGKMNNYANCKCEDKEGNCKICYDTIKKDTNNASTIYNSNP
jgi:hypothetical protein